MNASVFLKNYVRPTLAISTRTARIQLVLTSVPAILDSQEVESFVPVRCLFIAHAVNMN